MASFNTSTYTGQTTGTTTYPSARDAGGKLRYLTIPYVVNGAETNGDTINLGKLKVGSKVIPSLSRVISQAAFDANDVNIGSVSNPNAYADALDTTNAVLDQPFVGGDLQFAPAAIAAGDENVIATLVAVTTSTAGQLVLFLVAYVDE
tara:strand:- start:13644 stop:14087 length:444 start_codon:yes stop_codon:yes gene_type:complete